MVELKLDDDVEVAELEQARQAAEAEAAAAAKDLQRVQAQKKEVRAAERRGISAMERAFKAKAAAGRHAPCQTPLPTGPRAANTRFMRSSEKRAR